MFLYLPMVFSSFIMILSVYVLYRNNTSVILSMVKFSSPQNLQHPTLGLMIRRESNIDTFLKVLIDFFAIYSISFSAMLIWSLETQNFNVFTICWGTCPKLLDYFQQSFKFKKFKKFL